jgi:hypothetical protein
MSDKNLTSVWFVYCGWLSYPETRPSDLRDFLLVPYDSYESALWALREHAAEFTTDHSSLTPVLDFSRMDEQSIREAVEDEFATAIEAGENVLVEIRKVDIVNQTITGWRTLDLKAREDALNTTPVPPHRFEMGKSSGNTVVRCVVTHGEKQYFGPWKGTEPLAFDAAMKLIPS